MRSVELDSNLDCEIDGNRLSISASENLIVLDIPNITAGLKMLRSLPQIPQVRLASVDRLFDLLPLELEVRIKGKVVLALGQRESGYLLRLLGFRRLRVQPLALLVESARRTR